MKTKWNFKLGAAALLVSASLTGCLGTKDEAAADVVVDPSIATADSRHPAPVIIDGVNQAKVAPYTFLPPKPTVIRVYQGTRSGD